MMKGWVAFLAGLYVLSQFTVFEHYRTVEAHASWRAEAALAVYDTTTYADDRIVYLVSASIDTNIVGTDTSLFYMPDLSEAPVGTRGEVVWKGTHDSAMIVTGDTFNLAQMDSADATALASAWGVRDPYTVELAWHTPPDPGGAEPYLFVNFDDYETNAELDADRCTAGSGTGCLFASDSWYRSPDSAVSGNGKELGYTINLDTTVGFPGMEHSLRYDFTYTGGDCEISDPTSGNICDSQSKSTNIYLDTVTGWYTDEVWFEIAFRMADNFWTCNVYDPPCAYKSIFGNVPGANSRWTWRLGGEAESWGTQTSIGWRAGPEHPAAGIWGDTPPDTGREGAAAMGFHGEGANQIAPSAYDISLYIQHHDSVTMKVDTMWHVMRMYAKGGTVQSLDHSISTLDGRMVMWWNGVLLQDSEWYVDADSIEPWATTNLSEQEDELRINTISLGRNKDKGGGADTLANGTWDVPRVERIWWGYTKIWHDDPGWKMWPDTTPLVTDTIVPNWKPPCVDGDTSAPTCITTSAVGDTSNALTYWFADHYDSTADMRADLGAAAGDTSFGGIDAMGSYNANTDSLSFVDTTTAYTGLSSAVRFDWNYTGTESDCSDSLTAFVGCKARTIGFTLHNDVHTPGTVTDSMRTLWYEVSFRFSDNNLGCSYNETWGAANLPMVPGVVPDTTGWTNIDPPCAHKLVEFNPIDPWRRSMFVPGSQASANSRVVFEMFWADSISDTTGVNISNDLNNIQMFAHDMNSYLYDGEWHLLRVHMQESSDGATLDGEASVWVDDSLWFSTEREGATLRTDVDGYLARIKLGANKDHGGVGFVHTESMWWSHAIVWTDTPSWFSGEGDQ